MKVANINFPQFSGLRCLMMPYIQGEPDSIPDLYKNYKEIVKNIFFKKGEVGFLTIDESEAKKGKPHRGDRAKFDRALHTEAGRRPNQVYAWGSGGGWGSSHRVTLDRNVEVLLANNLDNSCAIWDKEEENTTLDGDIGHLSEKYPYKDAKFMKSGEVYKIGILTPHESIPVKNNFKRQFLRIISSGVHGREEHFTKNPIVSL